MPDLLIPDTNEYHPLEDYRGPCILRAAFNATQDHAFAHDAPIAAQQPWWGAYQYLSRSFDPTTAARAFKQILGDLRPSVTILDIEEGDGDQQPRQHLWLQEMASDPAVDWTYSGDYFARTHGLTVEWIAAYQNRAPTTAHTLWQFSERQQFPGMSAPCDGSVFLGTLDDLISLTGGVAPSPTPKKRAKMIHLIQAPGDAIYVTDLVTKRWIPNPTALGHIQAVIVSDGGNGAVEQWDKADVDAIPTSK